MVASAIRTFVKMQPRLYDFTTRLKPCRTDTEKWLDDFSRKRGRVVSFIQIGANDGLRCDPVRRFVVRDRWEGIFVEPLLPVFKMLKDNYAHLRNRHDLVFVNAAISGKEGENIIFWSFSAPYLSTLPLERQMDLLRKSSFDRSLVEGYLDGCPGNGERIEAFSVPVMTVTSLVDQYRDGKMTDLLVIDAEGHDDRIIMGIDLERYRPKAIIYESHNLAEREQPLRQFLCDRDYEVGGLGGDSVAVDTRGE